MRSVREGLRLQAHVIKSGIQTTVTTNQLIDLYWKHGFTKEAHKLFDGMPERNVVSWNTILNASIKSHDLSKARSIFYCCPCKDLVTYNSLLSGYARGDGYEAEAIALFIEMQHGADAATRVDEFTLSTMLNLVAKLRILNCGRQVHSFMVKSRNDFSVFALSSLIDMYSKCGSFRDACNVYNGANTEALLDLVVKNALLAACCREGALEMANEIFSSNLEQTDSVSWNTMISGYVKNEREEEAIKLFKQMGMEGFCWNEHTFGSLLTACSALRVLNLGKEVHARVLKEGMCSNPFISSGIVDIYSKCGNMKYAENVHQKNGTCNIFAINSLIAGYSAKGEMVEAMRLFNSLTKKNFVIWTVIISGYVELQQCVEAFILFRQYAANEIPDAVILVKMLCACAIHASLNPGKQIHAYILRKGISSDEKSISALIDMYSKCGILLYACRIFQQDSLKDTVIYNAMISGYAHHGYDHEAVHLFEEMKQRGVQPDAVTFIALLSACRHCGLVEAGEKYFLSMTRDYAIPPETNHYACMVDLYGRSKQLGKSISFMEKMPIQPDPVILSAFLNACRANPNLELARMAEKKLLEMEGENGGRYFQLASVYAAGGKWDEMGRVMRAMRGKEAKKLAGCSWIQIGSGVHVFRSGDLFHRVEAAVNSSLGCLLNDFTDMDELMV